MERYTIRMDIIKNYQLPNSIAQKFCNQIYDNITVQNLYPPYIYLCNFLSDYRWVAIILLILYISTWKGSRVSFRTPWQFQFFPTKCIEIVQSGHAICTKVEMWSDESVLDTFYQFLPNYFFKKYKLCGLFWPQIFLDNRWNCWLGCKKF